MSLEAGEKPPHGSRLAHAWLIEGLDPEKRGGAADSIARGALCENGGLIVSPRLPINNCACRHCKKGRLHPDITRIGPAADGTGGARREITVSQIRELTADSAVLPNEAARRVYIIEDADKMNLSAQNALLRLLEEPPAHLVLILCAENSGRLRETIRSRCVLLRAGGAEQTLSQESGVYAKELLDLITRAEGPGVSGALELDRFLTLREGMDAAKLTELIQALRTLLAQRLCHRDTAPGLSGFRAMTLYRSLGRAQEYLARGVSVKHVLGMIRSDAISTAE